MRAFSLIGLLLLCFLYAQPSYADAGSWPSHLPPKPELKLEKKGAGAVLTFKLGQKWKTYSDKVSDGGIPPKFDWKQSKNLKKAQVLLPKPERLAVLGVPFWGYRNFLAVPITIEARDKTKVVELNLKLSYAICDKICVPLEERFTLRLMPNAKM